MANAPIVQRILDCRIFAVLRLQATDRAVELAKSLEEEGIRVIEVTLNSKNAIDTIRGIERACPNVLVGAGTVIGVEASMQAVEAGAKFLVSPVTDLDMIAVAQQVGVASMAGALTATEAWQAGQAGADFIKLFPLAGLGPEYIKALRGPLPQLRYVATNGVTPSNVSEYFTAGAAALGLGSSLVTDADMTDAGFGEVRARARMAVAAAGVK